MKVILVILLGVFLFCGVSVAQNFAPGQSAASCNQSAVAVAYLNGLFSLPKDLTVIDRFATDPAYNHNPLAPDGAANLRNALGGLQQNFNYIQVQRAATQGYFTYVFSKYYLNFTNFATTTEPGVAVIDIFRFTPECRIIEHWDVNQVVTPASQAVNKNDMFSCLTCQTSPAPVPSSCDTLSLAKALLVGAFNARNTTIVDQIISSQTYVQHNPGVDNGIDALKALLPVFPPAPFGPLIKNIRGIADGNFVYLHNKYFFGPTPTAGVDTFRFDSNCKIVEHWDVLQLTPSYTASGNDMFSCLSCENNPYFTSCPTAAPSSPSPTQPPSTCPPSSSGSSASASGNTININFANLLRGR